MDKVFKIIWYIFVFGMAYLMYNVIFGLIIGGITWDWKIALYYIEIFTKANNITVISVRVVSFILSIMAVGLMDVENESQNGGR